MKYPYLVILMLLIIGCGQKETFDSFRLNKDKLVEVLGKDWFPSAREQATKDLYKRLEESSAHIHIINNNISAVLHIEEIGLYYEIISDTIREIYGDEYFWFKDRKTIILRDSNTIQFTIDDTKLVFDKFELE